MQYFVQHWKTRLAISLLVLEQDQLPKRYVICYLWVLLFVAHVLYVQKKASVLIVLLHKTANNSWRQLCRLCHERVQFVIVLDENVLPELGGGIRQRTNPEKRRAKLPNKVCLVLVLLGEVNQPLANWNASQRLLCKKRE